MVKPQYLVIFMFFIFIFSPVCVNAREYFTWENPLPQGNRITSIRVLDSANIFMCTDRGTVLTGADESWLILETGCEEPLNDIWGDDRNNIWAVGEWGTILHYDGYTWNDMSLTTSHELHGLWGVNSTDLFAAGSNGIIVHYNGSSWSTMLETGSRLRDVWGTDSSNVYTVGDGGSVLHYNGTSWSPVTSGVTSILYSVWGTSASSIYVTGAGKTLLHYNGSNWSLISSSGMPSEVYYSVWGPGETDIYVTESFGKVQHYDGTSWSSVTLPATSYQMTVNGASGSDIYFGGYEGMIIHGDGVSWKVISTGITTDFNDIWAENNDNIYCVGASGTIYHYDGMKWSVVPSGTTETLWGIWGTGSSDVFIVGDKGIFLHYNGTTVINIPTGMPYYDRLLDVWGTSATNVYTVGSEGTLLLYDGTTINSQTSPTTEELSAISGTGPDNIFAAESYYYIYHYDGMSWTESYDGWLSISWISNIWVKDASNVYTAGTHSVMHYDGATWTNLFDSTGLPFTFFCFTDVKAFSNDDLVVSGGDGTGLLLRYHDFTWSILPNYASGNLNTLQMIDGNTIIAAGEGGTILHCWGDLEHVYYSWCPGMNLISVPLEIPGVSTADQLLESFCGATANCIWKYDSLARTFNSWTDLDVGTGFPIAPGDALWANNDSGAPCTWYVEGKLHSDIRYSLNPGFSLVSVPLYSTSIKKASDLLNSVPDCYGIWRNKRSVDCTRGDGFDGYFRISSPDEDFPVFCGGAYWVFTKTPTTWTPPNP